MTDQQKTLIIIALSISLIPSKYLQVQDLMEIKLYMLRKLVLLETMKPVRNKLRLHKTRLMILHRL